MDDNMTNKFVCPGCYTLCSRRYPPTKSSPPPPPHFFLDLLQNRLKTPMKAAVSGVLIRLLQLAAVTLMVTSTTAFGLDGHVPRATSLLVSELATCTRPC